MRVFGWLLSAAVLAALGAAGLAWMFPPERQGLTVEERDAIFVHDRDAALGAGFVLVEEGADPISPHEHTVLVSPGTCVTYIAAIAGPAMIDSASFALPLGEAQVDSATFAVHHAACSMEGGNASIRVVHSDGAGFGPVELRWAILTGEPPSDPSTYPELAVEPRLADALRRDALERRTTAAMGGEPAQRISVSARAMLLAPVEPATLAARRALTGHAHHVPRAIDPSSAPVAEPLGPGDEESTPYLRTRAGRMRAIAAIDGAMWAAALGGGCVELAFTHDSDPLTPVPVVRVELPTLAETELSADDPAIAVDRRCPGDALAVYGTPEDASGDVTVSVRVVPGDGALVASTFALPAPRLPQIEALDAGCRAGDDDACVELAAFAADGATGAGDADALLGGVCDRRGGEACALLGARLATRDAARADALERRACATLDAPSCLRRAVRPR